MPLSYRDPQREDAEIREAIKRIGERRAIAPYIPSPCPLCKSNQIQFCTDYNNPHKDFCRCRNCRCQAPKISWENNRAKIE